MLIIQVKLTMMTLYKYGDPTQNSMRDRSLLHKNETTSRKSQYLLSVYFSLCSLALTNQALIIIRGTVKFVLN